MEDLSGLTQAQLNAMIFARICERIALGEPLDPICREEGMPSRSTVDLWRRGDPELAAMYQKARDDGFDAIAESCLEIADDARNDWMQGRDGQQTLNAEHVQRSKLRIETRLKLLAKWDPKRYGERVLNEHTGADGGAIEVTDPARPKLTREEWLVAHGITKGGA